MITFPSYSSFMEETKLKKLLQFLMSKDMKKIILKIKTNILQSSQDKVNK